MAKSGDKKRIQENLSFLSTFRIGLIVSNVRVHRVLLITMVCGENTRILTNHMKCR